jgi:predicted transcriptional regulator
MRLDPALKSWLEAEAQRQDRSASYIAQRAIAEMMQVTQAQQMEIGAANAEADKGVFISQDAMYAWMDTWDTAAELPPPNPDVFLKRA